MVYNDDYKKKVAVGNSTEAFVEEQFESGLNIISSDDNNKGKNNSNTIYDVCYRQRTHISNYF